MDIYSMVAVLSRCSYAIAKGEEGKTLHEQQIAQLFVRQASNRVLANLKEAAFPSSTGIRLIETIAQDVCDNQQMIQKHPVEVEA